MEHRIHEYIHALEALNPENLEDLLSLVDPTVHFRDPFNDCHGRANFRAVLEDMFVRLQAVEFRVARCALVNSATQYSDALIQWRMSAQVIALRNRPHILTGCADIRFNDQGAVIVHHDYWDAAGQLYENFPIIGGVLSRLRKRIECSPFERR